MKIGFDGKRAVQNYTGLGNYSRYMIETLAQYYAQNEYILYTPKKRNNERLKQLLEEYKQIKIAYPASTFWKKLSAIWRIWRITQQLKTENIQIYHGLSNELPLNIRHGKAKTVVTIHDLIFLRYPQYYKYIDRKIYAYKFKKACQNADKIIAISECTKKDIMHFFHIPEEKIEVIYQGCDDAFTQPVSDEKKVEVRQLYNLPDRYILTVGSIEERKNALLAVQAFSEIPKDTHLVILGRRTPYTERVELFIKNHNLTDRVHILTNVPFVHLPAIYQMAEIFVYPSRFEGFGIPIIEALHSGVPVVGATGSCLEEAGGPYSKYVDPDDVKGLIEIFIYLLSHPEARAYMIEKGKKYVERFSQKRQAEALMNTYKNLLENKN